jgi:hypothetical protein
MTCGACSEPSNDVARLGALPVEAVGDDLAISTIEGLPGAERGPVRVNFWGGRAMTNEAGNGAVLWALDRRGVASVTLNSEWRDTRWVGNVPYWA